MFFQHLSQSTLPVSVAIHLPFSIVFSHLIHSFFFFARLASSNVAVDGLVNERVGSFGAFCSGESGVARVFERPFKLPTLDPVVDKPSSKRVSIARSIPCVDLEVDLE